MLSIVIQHSHHSCTGQEWLFSVACLTTVDKINSFERQKKIQETLTASVHSTSPHYLPSGVENTMNNIVKYSEFKVPIDAEVLKFKEG